MPIPISSASQKKQVSIRLKFVILTVVVLVSFSLLAAVSIRGFDHLVKTIDAMNEQFANISRQAFGLENKSWEAQKNLLDAVYAAGNGSSWAEVEAQAGEMERALSEAREILIALFMLEDLTIEQTEALDEIYSRFESYAAPFAIVMNDIRAGTRPTKETIASVDEEFSTLVLALDTLDSIAEADSGQRYLDARVNVRSSYIIIAVVVGLGLAFLILVIAMTLRSISKGIAHLGGFISGVGSGDLRTLSKMSGKDELGTIAESVNGLVLSLRSLIIDLKDRLSAFADRERELMANIEETGAAAVQINGNISSNGLRLADEAQAVEGLSSIMVEASKMVESLGLAIREQTDILGSSAAAVEQLIANVDSVARSAQGVSQASSELKSEGAEGKSRIDDVNESVRSIEEVSESLVDAVKIIQDIASRTNLLAMNAAIEAAHAGDSGRGFAVVADEIRKLAEQSSSQAKDISSGLVKVSATVEGVRTATRAVNQAFASIVSKTDPLDAEIRHISEAIKEQGAGGSQLLGDLDKLKSLSADVQNSFRDLASGNGRITQQVVELKAINDAVFCSEKEIGNGTSEIQKAVYETTRIASDNVGALADIMGSAGHFITE